MKAGIGNAAAASSMAMQQAYAFTGPSAAALQAMTADTRAEYYEYKVCELCACLVLFGLWSLIWWFPVARVASW
jgi:hypothetical protein